MAMYVQNGAEMAEIPSGGGVGTAPHGAISFQNNEIGDWTIIGGTLLIVSLRGGMAGDVTITFKGVRVYTSSGYVNVPIQTLSDDSQKVMFLPLSTNGDGESTASYQIDYTTMTRFSFGITVLSSYELIPTT